MQTVRKWLKMAEKVSENGPNELLNKVNIWDVAG